MSDGGDEESKREREREKAKDEDVSIRARPDEYARASAKVAVAQVCEGVGFEGVKESSLEALSDIAIRYVCDLVKSGSFYANVAGRTECNVFDLVKGLEDLGSARGLPVGAEVNQCDIGSDVVKEIADFVGSVEEIPFAQPIPRFPVIKSAKGVPSFSQIGETPSVKHVPDWLPAFPDPHTYVHSPIWNERKKDPRVDKVEQSKQRRKAERSLLSLQQRLLLSHTQSDPSGSGLTGPTSEDNPFLAPPLSSEEKDIPPVLLPAKLTIDEEGEKETSVLDTFSPAIDTMKSRMSDSIDFERQVPLNRTSVVHFRLKTRKKMLAEDLDINLRKKSSEKKATWVGRDEERDDKKRKVEVILRQARENSELT